MSMAYQRVLSEATIPGFVRKESAWNIISDYSQYPAIMDNVENVEVIDRTSSEGISKWYVSVEEAPLYWMEKDHFSHSNYHIQFRSIEGDFDNINGQWHITDSNDSGIKISFEIEYNLGIPVIEEVLGDILHEKMKNNMEKIMEAITMSLNMQSKDERLCPRCSINRQHIASINGNKYHLFVHNLSAYGMMVSASSEIEKIETMRIATTFFDIAAVHANESGNRYRLIFRKPLKEALFASLRQKLVSSSPVLEKVSAGLHDALIITDTQKVPCKHPQSTA